MRAFDASRMENPGAVPALLERLLEGGRLVVRSDAGGQVGIQRVSADARRVAVDVTGAASADLAERRGVAGDDGREVHHLRHAQGSLSPQDLLDLLEAERPPRRLESARRHARGRHDEHVQGDALGRVEEPVHTPASDDVGQLVRVGDDGRRARGEHDLGEALERQHRGLDVDVGIDEPRHQHAPPRVQGLLANVASDAGKATIGHGDVALEPFPREDAEHARVAHHEVGGLVAASHGEEALPVGHRGHRASHSSSTMSVASRALRTSSGATCSSGWWLRPSRHLTNSSNVGHSDAITAASCPAPLTSTGGS